MLKEINRISRDRKRLAVKKPIEVAKFTFLTIEPPSDRSSSNSDYAARSRPIVLLKEPNYKPKNFLKTRLL